MSKFRQYEFNNVKELRYYVSGENMSGVTISATDRANGHPMFGDLIARNPDDHTDQWLMTKQYFEANVKASRPKSILDTSSI